MVSGLITEKYIPRPERKQSTYTSEAKHTHTHKLSRQANKSTHTHKRKRSS